MKRPQLNFNFFKPKPVNPYLPPRDLEFVGPGDFLKMGEKFMKFFIEFGGLTPGDTVLDIGSGNGRMAYPFKDFLKTGRYYGVEIVKKAVEWCAEAYKEDENIEFLHADVHSDRYNPEGNTKASAYRFPFGDASVDFIFLTSVFTHMLQEDMENYVREISRLLKPNGNCFITAFLINRESIQLMEKGGADGNFHLYKDNMYTKNDNNPEGAIAFEESYFLNLLAQNNLIPKEDIHYGRWCGRKKFTAYQDILVVSKKA